MVRAQLKRQRQQRLLKAVGENPFLKDDDLARQLDVSVATIRFDRAELGIAEYRERVKNVAKSGLKKSAKTAGGEVLDINLLHDGISVLQTDDTMTFEGCSTVKGQAIYAFAEDLAVKVIGARSALVKVANIKYIKEVAAGDKLVAKSEVIRVRDGEFIVWVRIKVKMTEVFRAKFNLISSPVSDEKLIPKGMKVNEDNY